jgi:PknH-like extracellular domain
VCFSIRRSRWRTVFGWQMSTSAAPRTDASLSCHTRNVSKSISRSSSGRSPKPSSAAPTVWTITSGALTVQQLGDFTHFVGPVVVSFPSPDEAAAFFTASAERWPACSNRQYTFSQAGKSDVVWTVGPVTNTNGTLITTETQEGVNDWSCERALSVRNNVAIDVIACSNSPSGSAVNVVQRMPPRFLSPKFPLVW